MPLPTTAFVGNLTGDPELRYTQAGKPVTTFSVACNDRYKNDQGEWVDGDTTYLTVVCWRNGEAISATLSKGTKVMVSGHLVQRNYETKEGQKRTVYEVKASDVAQVITDKRGVDQLTNSFETAPAGDLWPVSEDPVF